jgi:hypothetical protein
MRTRFIKFLCLGVSTIFLSGCSLNIFGQKSGLQITANPQVEVSLDGQSLGKTPIYQDSNKPGTYTLRMSPVDSSLGTWESKINLTSGAYTVVDRQYGKTPDQSSSYILSFEKLSDSTRTEVVVVSTPSNVSVSVDGSPTGFSTDSMKSTPAGDHTFTFSTPGYEEKVVRAKVQAGFRLVINVQMATQVIIPTPTPTPLATPSASVITPTPTVTKTTAPKTITPQPKQASSSATMAKPYVEILSTPTGFLRVRATASSAGAELAQVNPGDKFPYRENTTAGWLEIQYVTGKWGFVSSQYAKLVK